MYHYLHGQLVEKTPTSIILDVGGIGFHLQIPLSSYEKLPESGQTVRVLTHFVVREDAHMLYGFMTQEERRLFKLLISVSGIGPKTAMTALSGVSVADLKRAIVDGSIHILSGISGIGRKTAERIVVELREKLVVDANLSFPAGTGKSQTHEALIEDSLQALIALGYRRQNAKEAVQKALKITEAEKCSVEDLIRASLKYV
ncbi:MAG TPA: Holliday junction branch migration protein RuvA [bacterium]|nr:Holliday junction branch migration protein RuvA [bacterium]